MNTILFDGPERIDLLPFTFTRPVAEIRIGIMTLREKWEKALQTKTSTKTAAHLSSKWPLTRSNENLFINPAFLPSESLIAQIEQLDHTKKLMWNEQPVAFLSKGETTADLTKKETVSLAEEPFHLQQVYDIFAKNTAAIALDFKALTQDRTSEPLPGSGYFVGAENIFIEKGAKLHNPSLNAENGPIYIGKDAEIMEGCHIRGPFVLGDHSVLKMGAKIYGGTTLGPHCKVGGEVNNTVIFGYSNKGHDGFLGNSVLGEWCNIGADSNNSNLKNNYAPVKLWNYKAARFLQTGLQFCGLMMGDHSKCGINTMFNTGTVVGVSANIYGAGFPRNFIPSFSWGGASKMTTYQLNKVYEVAEMVMKRRDISFTQADKAILEKVFEHTQKYRRD